METYLYNPFFDHLLEFWLLVIHKILEKTINEAINIHEISMFHLKENYNIYLYGRMKDCSVFATVSKKNYYGTSNMARRRYTRRRVEVGQKRIIKTGLWMQQI